MNMVFHTKQTNKLEKEALRKRRVNITTPIYKMGGQANAIGQPNEIGQPNVSSQNMFASPMIERVVKAKSGCSACGR